MQTYHLSPKHLQQSLHCYCRLTSCIRPSCPSFTSPPKWSVSNVRLTTPVYCSVTGPHCPLYSDYTSPAQLNSTVRHSDAFHPPSTLGNFISPLSLIMKLFLPGIYFHLNFCLLRMPIHFLSLNSISTPLWNLSWLKLYPVLYLCSFFMIQHTAIFIKPVILNCTFEPMTVLLFLSFWKAEIMSDLFWGAWKKAD